jgi:hypothetical protein
LGSYLQENTSTNYSEINSVGVLQKNNGLNFEKQIKTKKFPSDYISLLGEASK